MAKAKTEARRLVRCYFCGNKQEVSALTMSTSCPKCHKAIKVEDIVVKSYVPVNDVQTTGKITITDRGRIAARRVMSGEGIECNGSIEGAVETDGSIYLGPKSSWKGTKLQSQTLRVEDGAKLHGLISVPWVRSDSV